MNDPKDYFLYRRLYPDNLSIISGHQINLEEFCKNAVFVLDTNSLLVPFNMGQESLNEIKRVYQQLLATKSLYVPAHTLKEFARQRSQKITELFTNVDSALSSLPSIKDFNYPILGEMEAYKKLKELKTDFMTLTKTYKGILENLQQGINEWNWYDPVTQLYHEIFNQHNIIDTDTDEETLVKEFEVRIRDGVPPGNKDISKEANAIGDYLIWKSMLALGKANRVDIVFVTNDEKNDWMLKGNKKSISTRFELVNEYSLYTDGQRFTCLNFADFLKIQGALQQVVLEVETIVETSEHNEIGKTYEILRAITNIISDFINVWDSIEDDKYVDDEGLEDLIKAFSASWKKEMSMGVLFSGLKSDFVSIEKLIETLYYINYEIHYQAIRMKRSTQIQQDNLLQLCKSFVSKSEVLLSTMELL
jgi:hypothetical protein